MRVFISWSGKPSRLAAEALRDWLPNVIQAVEPWISSKDVDKGARWAEEIAGELERSQVGILCLTPDNLAAPWVLFEAGALSKKLGKSLVCPFLLGIKPTDLQGPLVQFQAAEANVVDTFKLLETVNQALGKDALPLATLQRVFQKWWPDLEEQLGKISVIPDEVAVRRSDREILEETLSLVRDLAKQRPSLVLGLVPNAGPENIDVAIENLRQALAAPQCEFLPTILDNSSWRRSSAYVFDQWLKAAGRKPVATPKTAEEPISDPPEDDSRQR